MSRYVTVPELITAYNPITKKPIPKIDFDTDGKVRTETDDDPWTMYRWLITCVFVRKEWEKPLSRERQKHAILNKFEDADPGTVVELTDEQWRHLKSSIEADDFEMPKHFGYQLLAFPDAVVDAST
ncbi:MAG: hypothetical protein JSV86_17140 [Gemmatimonadota bacterium]|nr:MAG: hypothetical protein JSV86_17140 [Gemmatimonadota bacterium]